MANTAKFTIGYTLTGVATDSVSENFSLTPASTITRRIMKGNGGGQGMFTCAVLYVRAPSTNIDPVVITTTEDAISVPPGKFAVFQPADPSTLSLVASVGDRAEIIGV